MPTLSTKPSTDLDVAAPEMVARNLDHIADMYGEACAELQSAWGDESVGLIWNDFAKILGRAASACEKAMRKRGLA